MEITTVVSLVMMLALGVLLGSVLGALWVRSRSVGPLVEAAGDEAVVRESLERLHDQMRDLEQHRISWQSQLRQQVDEVRHSTDSLRRETTALSTALRKPQVRGRWGELHLRRAVEVAGMVSRCDFAEQVSLTTPDGVRRPDLVVNLAGGKHVVVDAKVPLDAFLDATGADSDEAREGHLSRHARQLRQHVDALGAKAYWRSLSPTPEFVVLFVPGESFLSAALESDPTLLEYAADRHVVLATPTTLIALLRTVAYAWSQEALAEKARDIHLLGRELYERLGVMGCHLDRLGRSLANAVTTYNKTVGSLETRVLVSARRFAELEVSGDPIASPTPVSELPRPLTSRELLEVVGPAEELADRRVGAGGDGPANTVAS